MSKWVTRKIEELGEVVGGATPSTKNEAFYTDGNIPWITPKDLASNSSKYISRGERDITESALSSCSAQLMPAGTVLFSSRAPIGYVAVASNPVCTNQGFKSVVPNKGTDSEFLYYLLSYNKDRIAAMGSGTTFKEVSGKVMRSIEVSVPESLDEQKRIAKVLKSIDDKINANNVINKN